ncbi:phosphoribosylformylglycinamidine cyclo-ligase [bacterium]|jgi:phosphoribosylformylglycinamidine cyclo-ligase|nr:phosphoribosylformylglycinamidine cyclo-ligase [bacterium]
MDYKSSGVDIDAGNRAVSLIKEKVASTFTPNVLQGIGSFAGFYELPEGYKKPVLVSCTDGVGTKLKLAIDSGKLDTVGIDLVAMCVNDLICCGAKPLFFLDYIACHDLVPEQMDTIIGGITQGCIESDCSLVGGEMAEMSDMYKKGDFDLAGFSVGVVEKDDIIDGSKIKPGDNIYGLPSSGIHSNGYSLVRKVLDANPDHGISLDTLLAPTKLYVNQVQSLIKAHAITGVAHITGGGLAENLERALPDFVMATINRDAIPVPDVFKQLQTLGGIADSEMDRVFNMGIGMIIISPDTIDSEDVIPLGIIDSAGSKGVSIV